MSWGPPRYGTRRGSSLRLSFWTNPRPQSRIRERDAETLSASAELAGVKVREVPKPQHPNSQPLLRWIAICGSDPDPERCGELTHRFTDGERRMSRPAGVRQRACGLALSPVGSYEAPDLRRCGGVRFADGGGQRAAPDGVSVADKAVRKAV
jgi:hypothetical protein